MGMIEEITAFNIDTVICELRTIQYEDLSRVNRPYKDLDKATLYRFFEDEELFESLSWQDIEELICEVHYKLCDEFKMPYFKVEFSPINLIGQDAFTCGYADYRQVITISEFPKEQLYVLSKKKRDSMGLSYLDAIVHETRHAYQYYNAKLMVKGEKVDINNAFVALELILSNSLYNNKFIPFSASPNEQYYLDYAEIDAHEFTTNYFLKCLNEGTLKNEKEVKNYCVLEDFAMFSFDYMGFSMADASFDFFLRIYNALNARVDVGGIAELQVPLKHYGVEAYKQFTQEREKQNIFTFVDCVQKKLIEYESSKYMKVMSPKIFKAIQNKRYTEVAILINQLIVLTDYTNAQLEEYYAQCKPIIKSVQTKKVFLEALGHCNKKDHQDERERSC